MIWGFITSYHSLYFLCQFYPQHLYILEELYIAFILFLNYIEWEGH